MTALRFFAAFALLGVLTTSASTAEPSEFSLKQSFERDVRGFLKNYCLECHGAEDPEAKLDLSTFKSVRDVVQSFQTWQIVLERIEASEMPPDDTDRQPTQEQRAAMVEWIRAVRDFEARRNAGDPGAVLVRRLSNAEYNYTIRDLTGVDIRPTRTFPVDPANKAGFDNSGESLAMSPALLNKYLGAAREVVEHLVLKPEGFDFAPHPVVTNTDRDKYCVKRIVEFYKQQPTDLAQYFYACWSYRRAEILHSEKPQKYSKPTFEDVTSLNKISPKYAALVWELLRQQDAADPIATLQQMFHALPPLGTAGDVFPACEKMRDYVNGLRPQLSPKFEDITVEGSHKGSQPFVLWKNRQYAAHRRKFDRGALYVEGNKIPDRTPREFILPMDEAAREKQLASIELFCSVFPDAFYISERGRDYLDKPRDEQEKGRLLSAGFHSMMGYFRDDGPLCDLILDEQQQRELNALWQELDFVASAPMRQYVGFLWFERTDSRFTRDPQFDFARAENKAAQSEEMIERLTKLYYEKAKNNGGSKVALQAIKDFYRDINVQIRWVEEARLQSETKHLLALIDFAERAYRRKMSGHERDDLLEFYGSLRQEHGLDHEAAMQDTIVSILMSPHFCYRLDLAAADAKIRPLADYELATRLSYFLWSSLPDERLLKLAAAGELRRKEVLLAETKRMLTDERVRGLATEFGGNWLDFRRFEEHNSVDRERFPGFTDELRQAMFEEPIRLFVDLVQEDRSALEFLHANYTFVNQPLAEHYGIADLSLAPGEWIRVDEANQFGRGGLLPMSVFMTKNAPGLRTSPVKRGYWVVRRLLGERIPAPPPNVPELPEDEAKLGDLTLREVLAKHRNHKSCASCHQRFDSIGLAFEGYGPVGERRDVDLGGRAIDDRADFPGGDEGRGLDGLRRYLREHRQAEFINNLCRKLLSYALGRSLLISDKPLIEDMQAKLASNDYRFGVMIESIVTSPQFLNKRGVAKKE